MGRKKDLKKKIKKTRRKLVKLKHELKAITKKRSCDTCRHQSFVGWYEPVVCRSCSKDGRNWQPD